MRVLIWKDMEIVILSSFVTYLFILHCSIKQAIFLRNRKLKFQVELRVVILKPVIREASFGLKFVSHHSIEKAFFYKTNENRFNTFINLQLKDV